ncbi:SDR family oxidoreductase [Paenibacillus sp. HN-1]|nr:SDR family oxidoreductase [Paenibacillus sp. CGMCC 1.18879]MBY9077388.1 SDR family oxidoreductase [Paenibacillus sp. CGMCC 1.18879]MBY9087504.1 SDR family oxidoreductase [Paenibacillus sinensis]
MLKNCIVVLTGGTSFLGSEIAIRLAQEGAHIIFTYLEQHQKGKEVIEKIYACGGSGEMVKVNLLDADEVHACFDFIQEKHGLIDVLINNAGIGEPEQTDRLSIEKWNKHLSLNLTAPFLCIQRSIDMLKKSHYKKIINISSVAALTGGSFGAHYAASKAGLIGLTKSIAKDYGKWGITANVVAPGPIQSEMTDSLGTEVLTKLMDATPQGRLGLPQEVSELVCQLINPKVNYITGQTIVIDGGRYMV